MLGPVKIGVSQSPDGRRKTLETWSPFALEIIAEIPGDRLIERRFHALFRETYVRHEWFSWSPILGQVVIAVNDGTFDVESLPSPTVIKHLHYKRKPWTPEQKMRSSYGRRMSKTAKETGYYCSVSHYKLSLDDPLTIAAADAYLADPAKHGEVPPWSKLRAA
jgi:hypothetical protein